MLEAALWSYTANASGQAQTTTDIHQDADRYTWIHTTYDQKTNDTMLQNLGISTQCLDALTASESRPGCLNLNNETILVIRGINTTEKTHPEHMVSLRIYIRDKLIITGRNTAWALQSIAEMKTLFDKSKAPTSPEMFVADLLERITDKIKNAVDSIEEEVLNLEQDELSSNLAQTLNQRRIEIANLRRFLTPQKNALEQFTRLQKDTASSQAYLYRNIVDRTQRYLEDLDLAKERTSILQEQYRNQVAQKQNDRMYLLSIITVIFLPLSFLTGVFGMNVADLPGLETPNAFWMLAGAMGLVGGGILAWLKIEKWL